MTKGSGLLLIEVTAVNHKDACPLLAVEWILLLERVQCRGASLSYVGLLYADEASGFKDSKLLVLRSFTNNRTLDTGESKF